MSMRNWITPPALVLAGAGLLAGIGVGFVLGSGGFGASATSGAGQDAHGTQEMQDVEGMEEMEGMDMPGMAMGGGTVRIARPVAGALGITSVAAELGPLRRRIRATGHVTYDETRLWSVNPKFGGWVEELHVDFTGRSVAAGEPLMEVYSPELVSAQEELLSARRLEESLVGSEAPGVRDRTGSLVESGRQRLRLWDISEEQIREIEESGEVRRTLTLHAPRTGFVVEKQVQRGARVQAGMDLYRMADLSHVWLEVDIHEQDLRFARVGEPVEVRVDAFPGGNRTGEISYIYPDVRLDSRTGRVRVELPNPDPEARLKPGMFATAHLDVPVADRAVTVPRDAVMYTGEGDIVFVERSPGAYEIREVEVGSRAGDRTEILSGLLAGEQVVARANFILDAESRLMETMMGVPDMPGMEMEGQEMDAHDPDAPDPDAHDPEAHGSGAAEPHPHEGHGSGAGDPDPDDAGGHDSHRDR